VTKKVVGVFVFSAPLQLFETLCVIRAPTSLSCKEALILDCNSASLLTVASVPPASETVIG
jgi:hypothetical protein